MKPFQAHLVPSHVRWRSTFDMVKTYSLVKLCIHNWTSTTGWVSHKKPRDDHNGFVRTYGLQLVFKYVWVYNCFQNMCITRSPQRSKSHCQVKYSQTWFSGLEIVRKDQSPSPWWCQTSHCAWNHWKNTNASLQKKPSKVLQLGETTDLKALLQFDNCTKLSKGC